jgi:hypothetical protein
MFPQPDTDLPHELQCLREENTSLRAELAEVLQVAVARGVDLGYTDEDFHARLKELGWPFCD